MPPKSEDKRIEILAFPIDVEVVLQHLHQDMRDDWFEDALQHRDLFANKADLREVLHVAFRTIIRTSMEQFWV